MADKLLVARDVLNSNHPLNAAFVAWLGEKQPTHRKAAEFLAAHPQYRTPKQA